MKKYIFLLTVIIVVVSCFSCKTPLVDRGLDFTLINNLEYTITWYIPPPESQFSNIDLPSERPLLTRFIPPGEKYGEFLQSLEHDNYFDELPTDTLHIFILKYELYKTMNWDSISSNLIERRITMTEENFDSVNYVIEIN